MGAHISMQFERWKSISTQNKILSDLNLQSSSHDDDDYPGSHFQPSDRKNWMSTLCPPNNLPINKIVWPATHNSATNTIGIPFITRPLGQCQTLSIYRQLCLGTRLLDIRVQQDRRVCHGILTTYSVDVVINDLKRFLSQTQSEMVIVEIRTEYGQHDPPHFGEYLEEQLGEYLIHEDEGVFGGKTLADVLPKRVICIWKPRDHHHHHNQPGGGGGGGLWSGRYIKDDWIDTELPWTKFESNMKRLGEQPTAWCRKYFYRVENTVTPQGDNPPVVCVWAVTSRVHGYARLFIKQCMERGLIDRLQVYSTDFIHQDFVDACVGLTHARIQGQL